MEDRIALLEKEIQELKSKVSRDQREDKLSIIAFSNDLDKILSTFILATGAAATGTEVHLFFTFWATMAMRKTKPPKVKKNLFERFFVLFMPRNINKLPLSRMNFGGMGAFFMKMIMKKNNTMTLNEFIEASAELGIKIHICEMSMELLGIHRSELIDYPDIDFIGVTQFLNQSTTGKITLFI